MNNTVPPEDAVRRSHGYNLVEYVVAHMLTPATPALIFLTNIGYIISNILLVAIVVNNLRVGGSMVM